MHENNCQLTCWNCPVSGLISHVALSQHLLSTQDPLLKNLNVDRRREYRQLLGALQITKARQKPLS